MTEEAAVPEHPRFEDLLEALEALTERMASGDIGIEEAADLYEQAQALHAEAEARLQRVQERIERLTPGSGYPVAQKSKKGGG